MRGYGPTRFSFNRPGGRCETCEGNGQRCIEMHFLPDVWITCQDCQGKRYIAETLTIQFKGHSIADVLDMRICEALHLFSEVPKIKRMLQTLDDVGLGYLQMGQPAPTLSGGESQRVRLAAELGRPSTGKTLYILDEPTTGLHFEDIYKLLTVLHRLVDLGNTVICIEHNLDVIKSADWIIDLGPEAGQCGGELVFSGNPEDLVHKQGLSHTARVLKPIIEAGPLEQREIHDAKRQALLEAELAQDIRLEAKDSTTRMPWESDGRRWHLTSQLDRQGKPTRWDPSVLEWVVDTIEKLGKAHSDGLLPADWNNPARVEIKGVGSKNRWLLHALTRGSALIDVSLRVPSKKYAPGALARRLQLGTLDDRDDLEIYGSDARVQIRRVDDFWDNVRILLHDNKDLKKRLFRPFLREVVASYVKLLKQAQESQLFLNRGR